MTASCAFHGMRSKLVSSTGNPSSSSSSGKVAAARLTPLPARPAGVPAAALLPRVHPDPLLLLRTCPAVQREWRMGGMIGAAEMQHQTASRDCNTAVGEQLFASQQQTCP